MNNKTKKWVLVGLVILIWGIIIMRFFSITSGDDDIAPIRLDSELVEERQQAEYILQANYRDPFLKNINPAPPKPRKEEVVKKRSNPRRSRFRPPNIQFNGMVTSDQEQKTALLNINETPWVIHVGDEVYDMELTSIKEDLITFYNQEYDTTLVVKLFSKVETKN